MRLLIATGVAAFGFWWLLYRKKDDDRSANRSRPVTEVPSKIANMKVGNKKQGNDPGGMEATGGHIKDQLATPDVKVASIVQVESPKEIPQGLEEKASIVNEEAAIKLASLPVQIGKTDVVPSLSEPEIKTTPPVVQSEMVPQTVPLPPPATISQPNSSPQDQTPQPEATLQSQPASQLETTPPQNVPATQDQGPQLTPTLQSVPAPQSDTTPQPIPAPQDQTTLLVPTSQPAPTQTETTSQPVPTIPETQGPTVQPTPESAPQAVPPLQQDLAQTVETVKQTMTEITAPNQTSCASCYCRVSKNTLDPSEWKFNPKLEYSMTSTRNFPIQYETPKGIDLTVVPLTQTTLSDEVRGIKKTLNEPTRKQSFLTPFEPILHAIEYADRHAAIIQTLLHNYDYLENG